MIQNSDWSTRAWTFQEGVLSKSLLFISDQQIYFQCRSAYYTEDFIGEHDRTGLSSGAINPFEREITEIQDAYSPKFNIYESLVKDYSNRQLSYHSDALNAFTGIIGAIQRLFEWQFISSLPEEVFDLSILWRPMMSISSRPRISMQSHSSFACTTPTWCWTSWEGDIYWDPWRFHSYAGRKVTLISEVQQYLVWIDNNFRQVGRPGGRLAPQDESELETKAQKYFDGLNSNSTGLSSMEIIRPPLVLFFQAAVIPLEHLSVSSPGHGLEDRYSQVSPWLQQRFKVDTWIYDAAGYHCGTLHGLDLDWIDTYDFSRCELIILSRCGQAEVTPEDIASNRTTLPLERPSRQEYYDEIFDSHAYGYTKWWAVNIMLIERMGSFARRVSIGQIHVDAWTGPGVIKLIALA